MSTHADQLGERVIVTGQAQVQIVEAAVVLLSRNPAWIERPLLRLVRARYSRRPRGLVAALPADITGETGEILAASEKMASDKPKQPELADYVHHLWYTNKKLARARQ